MKKVTVTLKHGRGTVKITTVSSSIESAIRSILNTECAPVSAIRKIISKPI